MGLFSKSKKKNAAETPPETTSPGAPLRVGFVLLETPEIDWDALFSHLQNDWGITVTEKPADDGPLMFEHDGMTVAAMFIPAPIPDQEAETNAKNNFLWPEGVEVAGRHKAQVILSIMSAADPIAQSLLYTKAAAAFLKLNNALALYQAPTVISAQSYVEIAQEINDGELPIQAWIFVGLYGDGDGVSGYTAGMEHFGKHELEVLQSQNDPADVFGFLYNIINYIIENDVTLKDGETIGFSAEQKLKITLSKGVATENDSLKLGY